MTQGFQPPTVGIMVLWVLSALGIIQLGILAATEKKFSVEEYPRLKVENQSAELFCNYTCKSSKLMTMKVSLLKGIKGTEEVCSIHWNGTYNSSKVNSEFRCFMNVSKEDGSVTFKLRNLHINQTDIYNCRIDILYPPPFDRRSSKGVVIHVKAPEPRLCTQHSMTMAAAIGVIAFYSMLVTAAFFYCWLKRKKKRILRNDYFNMTPWQTHHGVKKKHQLPPAALTRNYTAYRSWQP